MQREKEDANQRERHRPTRAEKDHLGLKYVEVDSTPNWNAQEIGISERSNRRESVFTLVLQTGGAGVADVVEGRVVMNYIPDESEIKSLGTGGL